MDTTIETYIAGGVWRWISVPERPELVLTDWAVFELQLPDSSGRTRHFVGHNAKEREAWVSSAVDYFDPTNWRGVTQCGQVCGLRGRPGLTPVGDEVWRGWISRSGASEAVDVTNGLLAMMAHK